jgi:hypothetical protein
MNKKLQIRGVLTFLLAFFILIQLTGCSEDKLQNGQESLPLAPTNTTEPTAPLIEIEVIPKENTLPSQPTPAQQIQTATVTPKVADGKYTIAWISDTQHYSRYFPETFLTMTRYLKKNREKLNLGYVLHTGDLVASGTDITQWKNAKRAMDELSSIPYGVLAGNHDVGQSYDYTNYSAYFGEKAFDQYAYYGESLLNNRCHYDLITMGNTDYVFIYLGYQPGEASVRFANEVFAKYEDRVGILCVHEYLGSHSTLRAIGQDLYAKVVKPNPNVYMVLSGHRYNEDCVPVTFDDDRDGKADRTVYQCIANYQDIDKKGGSGYMRFLEIDEEKGTIRFYTYSPLLDQYRAIPKTAITQEATLPIPWK